LLRKQNLLPEKQKCFLANSETSDASLCFSQMFPIVFAHSGKHDETLAGNNVSATMFPSLPRAKEHGAALESLLQRFRECGLNFNPKEMQYHSSVSYTSSFDEFHRLWLPLGGYSSNPTLIPLVHVKNAKNFRSF
jgi:hypothetical protein